MAKATWFARGTHWVSMLLALGLSPGALRAQDVLRVALFKTASDQPELRQLAAAVDPVLHSELGEVPSLEVAALPALDLPGLQLAVDCVGETPECLRSAAAQAQTQGLVAPSLTKTDSAVVLSLVLFDPRSTAPIKAVTRNLGGAHSDQQVLDAVPELVRELFDLAPPQAAEPAPSMTPLPSEPPPLAARRPSLLWPIVLGGVGVAMIGAGVGLGVASKNAQDDYAGRHVKDTNTATSAWDRYKTARSEAMLADIGFAVGGAALLAGVIVFVVQHKRDDTLSERAHGATRIELGLSRLTLTSTWN